MLLLFIGRITSFNDFNIEVKRLASQRMIRIDGDSLVANFNHTNNLRAARCLGLELHAWLNGINAFKS